jgi:hypothetical protein
MRRLGGLKKPISTADERGRGGALLSNVSNAKEKESL